MKPLLEKALKLFRKFFLWLFLGIGLYLGAAFILARIRVNSADPDPKAEVAVYLRSNGVHTDIVVPVRNSIKDWSNDVKYLQTLANDSTMRFVAFGWGNKDFYLNTPQWSDLKVSTALKAAFHIGETAMHTQFYSGLAENGRCRKILMSAQEYRKLCDYISASFSRTAQGETQWIQGFHYNRHDAFYKAHGKYDLFHTCNSWTNRALKASGQKAAVWALTDKAILRHYED